MFLIQDLILTNVKHLPMQHATLAVGAVVAGAGILSSVLGGIMGGNAAKDAARKAAAEKAAAAKRVAQLEASRQQIINPYAGVKDLSGMAKDLSGMISNTYANLGVAISNSPDSKNHTWSFLCTLPIINPVAFMNISLT